MTKWIESPPSKLSTSNLPADLSWLATRDVLRWKSWFYKGLLPYLSRRGPIRAGEDLERLGTWIHSSWPPRRRQLLNGLPAELFLRRPELAPADVVRGLSKQMMRYLARDCLMTEGSMPSWNALFDVEGFEHVQELTSQRRGAILLGCHLGGHLAAVRWMLAQEVPLRMLVQRPRNVSRELNAWFDQDHPICPQRELFLKRDLSPSEASRRTMDVRRLIRQGVMVYSNCDITWHGTNTDVCRFLGKNVRFQSIWIDLASILGCPVIRVECRQIPGGRFRLRFDRPFAIAPQEPRSEVFERTMSGLENSIVDYPDDAIAHLTWSQFRPNRHGSNAQNEPRQFVDASRTEDGHSTAKSIQAC